MTSRNIVRGLGMASVRWDKSKKRFRVNWSERGKRSRKFFQLQDVAFAFAAKIERAKEEVRAGFKASIPVMFKDFSEVYIGEVLKYHSNNHRVKETSRVRQMAATFANFMLQDVTPIALKRFIRQRRDQGMSHKTINNELGTLSAMLREAMDRGYVENNPVSKIKKLPKAPTRHAKVVSESDFGKFLAKANPMLRRYAIFLYNTGFRAGEALNLKWKDIREGLIFKANEQGRTNKAYNDRFCPMSDAVKAVLGQRAADDDYVFQSKTEFQKPYNEHTMRDAWDVACRRAGVKFNRHDLRHTYISLMVHNMRQLKVDDRTIMAFSGHATMGMLQNYSHLIPGEYDHLRNAVNVGGEWADNVVSFKEKTG